VSKVLVCTDGEHAVYDDPELDESLDVDHDRALDATHAQAEEQQRAWPHHGSLQPDVIARQQVSMHTLHCLSDRIPLNEFDFGIIAWCTILGVQSHLVVALSIIGEVEVPLLHKHNQTQNWKQ